MRKFITMAQMTRDVTINQVSPGPQPEVKAEETPIEQPKEEKITPKPAPKKKTNERS